MPYEIRVEEDLFTLCFEGTIGSDDLQQSMCDVEDIEAVHERTPDRITDLSRCDTAAWNFLLIEALAARRRRAQLKNHVKSAIYAPTDLQFGFSRMFQMLNDNPRIELAVFRDRAAADKWVRNGAGRAPDAG